MDGYYENEFLSVAGQLDTWDNKKWPQTIARRPANKLNLVKEVLLLNAGVTDPGLVGNVTGIADIDFWRCIMVHGFSFRISPKDPSGLGIQTDVDHLGDGLRVPVPHLKDDQYATRQLGPEDNVQFSRAELKSMIYFARNHPTGTWVEVGTVDGKRERKRQAWHHVMYDMTRQLTTPIERLDRCAWAIEHGVAPDATFLPREGSPFMPSSIPDALERFSGCQDGEGEFDMDVATIYLDRDGRRLTNFNQNVGQHLLIKYRSRLPWEQREQVVKQMAKTIKAHKTVTQWQEAARSIETVIQTTTEADGKRGYGRPSVTLHLARCHAREVAVVGKLIPKFDKERLEAGEDERVLLRRFDKQWAMHSFGTRFHVQTAELSLVRPYYIHGDSKIRGVVNRVTIVVEQKPSMVAPSVANHGLLSLIANFMVVDCEHEACSVGLASATESCHHDEPYAAQNWVGNVIGQSHEDTRLVRKVARDRHKLNGQITEAEVNHGQTLRVFAKHFKAIFNNKSLSSADIWKMYPFIGLRGMANRIFLDEWHKDQENENGFIYRSMLADLDYGETEKQMIKFLRPLFARVVKTRRGERVRVQDKAECHGQAVKSHELRLAGERVPKYVDGRGQPWKGGPNCALPEEAYEPFDLAFEDKTLAQFDDAAGALFVRKMRNYWLRQADMAFYDDFDKKVVIQPCENYGLASLLPGGANMFRDLRFALSNHVTYIPSVCPTYTNIHPSRDHGPSLEHVYKHEAVKLVDKDKGKAYNRYMRVSTMEDAFKTKKRRAVKAMGSGVNFTNIQKKLRLAGEDREGLDDVWPVCTGKRIDQAMVESTFVDQGQVANRLTVDGQRCLSCITCLGRPLNCDLKNDEDLAATAALLVDPKMDEQRGVKRRPFKGQAFDEPDAEMLAKRQCITWDAAFVRCDNHPSRHRSLTTEDQERRQVMLSKRRNQVRAGNVNYSYKILKYYRGGNEKARPTEHSSWLFQYCYGQVGHSETYNRARLAVEGAHQEIVDRNKFRRQCVQFEAESSQIFSRKAFSSMDINFCRARADRREESGPYPGAGDSSSPSSSSDESSATIVPEKEASHAKRALGTIAEVSELTSTSALSVASVALSNESAVTVVANPNYRDQEKHGEQAVKGDEAMDDRVLGEQATVGDEAQGEGHGEIGQDQIDRVNRRRALALPLPAGMLDRFDWRANSSADQESADAEPELEWREIKDEGAWHTGVPFMVVPDNDMVGTLRYYQMQPANQPTWREGSDEEETTKEGRTNDSALGLSFAD